MNKGNFINCDELQYLYLTIINSKGCKSDTEENTP